MSRAAVGGLPSYSRGQRGRPRERELECGPEMRAKVVLLTLSQATWDVLHTSPPPQVLCDLQAQALTTLVPRATQTEGQWPA
jgi:hypothetical protein